MATGYIRQGSFLYLPASCRAKSFDLMCPLGAEKKRTLDKPGSLCCGDQPAATVISDVPQIPFLSLNQNHPLANCTRGDEMPVTIIIVFSFHSFNCGDYALFEESLCLWLT